MKIKDQILKAITMGFVTDESVREKVANVLELGNKIIGESSLNNHDEKIAEEQRMVYQDVKLFIEDLRSDTSSSALLERLKMDSEEYRKIDKPIF